MKLLVKGGRIIDPANNTDMVGDVLIADGVIQQVAASIKNSGAQVVDASNKIVCPGLIDMHVHLREPGFEQKETIETGSRAAAVGGFTSICPMPNTHPVNDHRTVTAYIQMKADICGKVNVFPIGSITKGQAGQEISEMADLLKAGCVAFSDDGKPVMNPRVMLLALNYTKMFDVPVIAHCEDMNLTDEGQVHEGYYSTYYGMKGIPALAEEVMVARDIMLAKSSGGRLHIAHVSTAGSLELIRRAKAEGVMVTCEVTPHHLTLTDEIVGSYDADTKVNPPLRSAEHLIAMAEGLADGTIDCIATDHAPHEWEVKDCEYNLASFGISGLETAVAVVFDRLVHTGRVSLIRAIEAWTAAPARILGLDRGTLSIGAAADITVIDPEAVKMVQPELFQSKGRNTPYKGMTFKGWPCATILNGKIVAQDGSIIEA